MSEPLTAEASARARIRERLTDHAVSAFCLDPNYYQFLREQIADALAPLLVEAEQRVAVTAAYELKELRERLAAAEARADALQRALGIDEGTAQDVIAMAVNVIDHPYGPRLLRHCIEQGKRVEAEKQRADALQAEVEKPGGWKSLVDGLTRRAESAEQRADALAAELAVLRAGPASPSPVDGETP